MKASARACGKQNRIMQKYGYCIKEGAWLGRYVHDAISQDKAQYVSIQIADVTDRYENTDSFENFRSHGHLEVTVGICRMGTPMGAEELREAASQLARCGAMLEEIGRSDLLMLLHRTVKRRAIPCFLNDKQILDTGATLLINIRHASKNFGAGFGHGFGGVQFKEKPFVVSPQSSAPYTACLLSNLLQILAF